MTVHTVHRKKVFGRLIGAQLLFRSNCLGQQCILGPGAQLFGDFLVEALNGRHLFQGHIGHLFQGAETLFHQDIGNIFVNVQLLTERLDHLPRFGLMLFSSLFVAHHVDRPVGELAGEPHILSGTANRLGEVLFRHGDIHRAAVFVYHDRLYLGR